MKIHPALKWAFWITCAVPIVGAVVAAIDKPSEPAETPAQQAESKKNKTLHVLAGKCTGAIKASLKYPEDAEIPNINSASDQGKFLLEEKSDIYRVQVAFKARIESNALRNSVAECKWQLVNDEYKPLGMQLIE